MLPASSSFRWFPATLGFPWPIGASPQSLPPCSHELLLVCLSHMMFSSLCVCAPIPPLLVKTPVILDLDPSSLVQPHLNRMAKIQRPYFQGHICRHQGLGLQHIFLGNTGEPSTVPSTDLSWLRLRSNHTPCLMVATPGPRGKSGVPKVAP